MSKTKTKTMVKISPSTVHDPALQQINASWVGIEAG